MWEIEPTSDWQRLIKIVWMLHEENNTDNYKYVLYILFNKKCFFKTTTSDQHINNDQIYENKLKNVYTRNDIINNWMKHHLFLQNTICLCVSLSHTYIHTHKLSYEHRNIYSLFHEYIAHSPSLACYLSLSLAHINTPSLHSYSPTYAQTSTRAHTKILLYLSRTLLGKPNTWVTLKFKV